MQQELKKPPTRYRLRCPCCAGRLMDSDLRTSSKLYDMEVAEEFSVDYLVKCSQCKREIGIKKVSV